MIKINQINKYYFKGDSREIHVVNDVSLELPKTGLITILGASGSGKTTLLNIIGGLDKYDSGNIDYDGNVFNRYHSRQIDDYRAQNIGYIFQNYLLLEDLSVYNNLKEALEIIGIYDPIEQKKRIEYALRKIGLYKYRKKKVKFLSGGQMQRVSIARALVKNAQIIIADEPTGNIDSENTIEIMNILKKISKNTLVLLITHELEIARYYSDRIIQIKDGKIIADGKIINKGELNQQTDRKIYLGDFQNQHFQNEAIDLNLYFDQSLTNTSLQIIIKNDTIYVSSNNRIVNVNESSLEICNGKSSTIVENNLERFDYDTSWYLEPKKVSKLQMFFKILKKGFIEFFTTKRGKIPFMIIFMLLGSLIGVAVINLNNYAYVDVTNVYPDSRVYVTMKEDEYDNAICPYQNINLLTSAIDNGYIKELIPINLWTGLLSFNINHIQSIQSYLSGYIVPYDNQLNLLVGTIPNNFEIAISKKVADEFFINNELEIDYNLLLNRLIYLSQEYKIVGIVDSDDYCLYTNIVNAYNIDASLIRVDELAIGLATADQDCYEIINGKMAENNTEMIVSDTIQNEYQLQLNCQYVINEQSITLVGIFKNNDNAECHNILTLNEDLIGYHFNPNSNSNQPAKHNYYFGYLPKESYYVVKGKIPEASGEIIVNINSGLTIGEQYNGVTIVGYYEINCQDLFCNNNSSFDDFIIVSMVDYLEQHTLGFIPESGADEFFKAKNYTMLAVKEYQTNYLNLENHNNRSYVPVLIGFLLLFVICYTYFSNRSKMINEIYQIGVYRSLGATKKSIIDKYLAYNFAQTTLSAIIGYGLTFVIYIGFKLYIGNLLGNEIIMQPLMMVVGIVGIYLINLLVGILPIVLLLRKTPAEINSKYDI